MLDKDKLKDKSVFCIPMSEKSIYKSFLQKRECGNKALAVLIDPDKNSLSQLKQTVSIAEKASVDYFFVGSSLLLNEGLDRCVSFLKKNSAIPVILFPGNRFQISGEAEGILLLSLISGRNPELLIGQHAMAAPQLKSSGLEIIPTGYMLIDGGKLTSVNYVSQTLPIPSDKNDIAVSTAMAGEMLGLKAIYLEAGSGAKKPVSESMIADVRKNIVIPLIVGGGICDAEKAYQSCKAGADILVVGNSFETQPALIFEISNAIKEAGKISNQKTSAI